MSNKEKTVKRWLPVVRLPHPDGAERSGMQSIASGSFSHPGSSSNKDSSGGGSQGPSNGDTLGARAASSLNVLAKPFISPGTDATPSDSMSLGLKSPRHLAITPGPCPSQDPVGPAGSRPMLVRGGDELTMLVQRTPTSLLEPLTFFVSWQGVPTLVFRGFPPAITQLKGVFERMHPTLPKENPGSRWPKTSLGALRDAKRLTPDQLKLLLKICREEGAQLQEGGLQPLEIDRAALCIFECRSLERLMSWAEVPFTPSVDSSEPTPEEVGRVEKILSEADDDDYWFAASKDGNRISHYREEHLGVSLVYGLPLVDGSSNAGRLWSFIHRFRMRVDLELPDMYNWFADCSLHVTLRAIMG
ncbi:g4409 [Coccomyxa viridis]|uniref:G4409 protein n=1 Tax=Coccomyxa viridis TaxID=1274662 RepID=A0ABP1FQ78_9CHLO